MYFFWIKSFTITLLSAITAVLTLDDRFGNFIGETRKDFALGVPVFQTLPDVNGFLECGFLCLRISLCMYYNYQISADRGICEVFKGLHFQNRTELEGLLRVKQGFAFVQAISKGPYSCFDYLSMRQANWILKNGLYEVRDRVTQLPYMVYCDFTSEPRYVWTLLQSMSYNNIATFRTPYMKNAPKNQYQPNFASYRMTREQMECMKTGSSHWRITCNFQTSGPVNYRDYVRGKLSEVDPTMYLGPGTCKQVEFLSIRGHNCTDCMIPWWQGANALHTITTASHWTGCGNSPVPGSVQGENSFGSFKDVNQDHSCVSSATSTTNTWVGRHY